MTGWGFSQPFQRNLSVVFKSRPQLFLHPFLFFIYLFLSCHLNLYKFTQVRKLYEEQLAMRSAIMYVTEICGQCWVCTCARAYVHACTRLYISVSPHPTPLKWSYPSILHFIISCKNYLNVYWDSSYNLLMETVTHQLFTCHQSPSRGHLTEQLATHLDECKVMVLIDYKIPCVLHRLCFVYSLQVILLCL
jgi:hypothetical protein